MDTSAEIYPWIHLAGSYIFFSRECLDVKSAVSEEILHSTPPFFFSLSLSLSLSLSSSISSAELKAVISKEPGKRGEKDEGAIKLSFSFSTCKDYNTYGVLSR